MIGGKHDHRFVVEIGLLEDLDQPGDPLVDSGNALVIMSQFLAGFRSVGKEGGNRYFFRIVKHFLDPVVSFSVGLVSEKIGLELELGVFVFPAAAMGVGSGEIQKERIFAFRSNEFTRLLGHIDGVPAVSPEISPVVKDLFGGDVVFTNMPGLSLIHI